MKHAPIFFVKNGQVASLNRSHILRVSKRYVPHIDSLIREIRVPCVSVAGVLQRSHIGSRSLAGLVIDAEGHDAAILASIDWSDEALRPHLLVFERLGMGEAERHREVQRLQGLGYACTARVDVENFWCVRGGNRTCSGV